MTSLITQTIKWFISPTILFVDPTIMFVVMTALLFCRNYKHVCRNHKNVGSNLTNMFVGPEMTIMFVGITQHFVTFTIRFLCVLLKFDIHSPNFSTSILCAESNSAENASPILGINSIGPSRKSKSQQESNSSSSFPPTFEVDKNGQRR